MSSKMVWRVNVDSETYPGEHDSYLLRGKSAAIVEKIALGMSKERDKDLVKGDKPTKPYIRSIDFLGELSN